MRVYLERKKFYWEIGGMRDDNSRWSLFKYRIYMNKFNKECKNNKIRILINVVIKKYLKNFGRNLVVIREIDIY